LQPPETRKQRTIKLFCLILLFGSLAEFAARGPLRAVSSSSDFALPYLAARSWRKGENPYNHESLDKMWRDAGGEEKARPVKKVTPSIYPPTTLILIAPLTFWSWNSARSIMLVINIALIFLVIKSLISIAQFDEQDWRTTFFWAFAIGLAPLHTGIALGNLAVPSVALTLLAVWAASLKQELLAGLLLALAICLKPHIGGIVWLGYALQRRWRICSIAAGISLMLATLAIMRLELSQVDWVSAWRTNYHESLADGGTNNPTASNLSRHHLLNLQWLLHTFLEQRWLVNLLTLGFVGSQVALLCAFNYRRRSRQNSLLFFSAMIVLGLLVTYHRFYDATLLILPLLWSLIALPFMKQAHLSLFLIIPFLVPGAVILKEMIGSGYLPCHLELSWWWNIIILPHQVWLLAILSLCLTYTMTVKLKEIQKEEKYGHSAI